MDKGRQQQVHFSQWPGGKLLCWYMSVADVFVFLPMAQPVRWVSPGLEVRSFEALAIGTSFTSVSIDRGV